VALTASPFPGWEFYDAVTAETQIMAMPDLVLGMSNQLHVFGVDTGGFETGVMDLEASGDRVNQQLV
jgi:hypothetical protein